MHHKTSNEPPFDMQTRQLGLRKGIDPARLNQLADELEADAFLALSRTLEGEERARSVERK
ncbi:MAG TPA: hypothetical protein DCL48_09335 [Alphaproteobacteria bacterium]|nr:hypothetical protein [Alphaproteobacteria bacterium]